MLGRSARQGKGTLTFSVMRKGGKTGLNQYASSRAIGYLCPLWKRNDLSAVDTHIRNKNGAGDTVADNSESGSGNTRDNLGFRHSV